MNWNPKAFSYFTTIFCLTWGLSSFAAQEIPQTWTLDGKLYQTGNSNPLLDNAAKVTIQIIDPSGACLLYEEQQTIDTKTTSGYFSIHVGSATGSAKRTVNDPGRSMVQIFQNQTGILANSVPGKTCAGGAYSPALGAVRYFRLIVTPSATNVADTLTPDIVIDSVPNAIVAQSVQGLERANILQTSVSASTALTQANLDALFTTPAYTNLQSILGGNFIKTDSSGASLPSYAADPAGVSNGDIWFDTTTNEIKFKNAAGIQTVGAGGSGGISSLTVGSSMSINGTVAGTISSSGTIDLSNTGVSAGTYTKVAVDTKGRVTAGTVSLVEADIPNLTVAGKVSGNTITSGTISGSAGVNTSGNLISTGTVSGLTVQATNLRVYNGTNYVQFVAPTLAGIVNFTLPDNDGNPGDVLTSNGSGILSWAAGTTTLAGDVSGPSGTTSVDKIKGKAVTAASVSGQIMIYDGIAWTNNVVSGDATLAHNGIFTLNKVPVSKGGTNSTTFGNNRIIASNGTGSAFVDFSCPLNQVITFDASGNSTCANVSSLITALVNGGNTTGGTISVGSNDNHALQFKTNNTIAMTISQNGRVGIGTQSPSVDFEVVANYTAARFQTIQNGNNVPAEFIATNGGAGFSLIPYVRIYNSLGANNSGMGLFFSGKDDHPAVINVAGIEGRMTNNASGNHAGILAFGTTTGGSNITERMRISETGDVGIGLTNPSTALDISGAFTAQGMSSAPSVSASNTGRIYYDYSANKFKVSQNGAAYTDLVNASGYINGGNAFGANAVLGTTDSRPLSLITANSTAMSISQSGYVGIGTTNPSEKLEVNGGIKLGLTTGTGAGTIRWDGANFQGYDGTAWSNFTLPAPPAGACDTTVTFSVAGTYNYTIPASFGTITIQLWGAGGGGAGAGSSIAMSNGSSGGTTSIAALGLTAMGGSGGQGSGTGGTGGTASGGTTNTTGGSGSAGFSTTGGTGGNAPGGGSGGVGIISYSGNNGAAPGGGGAGGGYSIPGGGGGSGAYVSKTFSSATLIPGTTLTGIVVGGGGAPSTGWGGRDGGYGGIGRVTITCASAGAAPVNDRGIVFWDSGTHASSSTFVHDASGNVGVGTATPTAKLDVVGQARTTTTGGVAKVNTSAAVDWNNGNAQSMSVACTTTTFTNMLDGGTYILAVSETGTTTCTFSQAGLTFFYNPANGARTSGQRTVYTFQRIGTDVYVSWIPGFQ